MQPILHKQFIVNKTSELKTIISTWVLYLSISFSQNSLPFFGDDSLRQRALKTL